MADARDCRRRGLARARRKNHRQRLQFHAVQPGPRRAGKNRLEPEEILVSVAEKERRILDIIEEMRAAVTEE